MGITLIFSEIPEKTGNAVSALIKFVLYGFCLFLSRGLYKLKKGGQNVSVRNLRRLRMQRSA
ncbi:hypothetical protein HMPREF1986_01278 [Oribacterium sp. oral taxon 078 str. F0263]|nr:hypothetical protein HMPREF1986_01278 [Oribacterium sp. oral taxon 078 str. F0263]